MSEKLAITIREASGMWLLCRNRFVDLPKAPVSHEILNPFLVLGSPMILNPYLVLDPSWTVIPHNALNLPRVLGLASVKI